MRITIIGKRKVTGLPPFMYKAFESLPSGINEAQKMVRRTAIFIGDEAATIIVIMRVTSTVEGGEALPIRDMHIA